jgi:hypothetical protein
MRGYLHTLGYYIEGNDYDLIRTGTVIISCRQIKNFDDPLKDGEQIADDIIEYFVIRGYDEFLP